MAEEKANKPTPRQGRPHISADYGIDPANEVAMLPWSWLSEQMEKSRSYWVSTTRPDGKPHAMPVWGVWIEDEFYFSTGRNSRKGRNLAANPEIAIHLESGDEVVIFEGTVEEFTNPDFFAHFAEVYNTKYSFKPEQAPGNVYYKLIPRVAFCWLESDFVNSATRWSF